MSKEISNVQTNQTNELVLTNCQKMAMEKVLDAWDRGIKRFGLYGGGGVGKTFIASVIIKELQSRISEKAHCLLIAPTNSAVKSLKRSFGNADLKGVEFRTIHSALGIQGNYNDTGKMVFQTKKGTVEWACKIAFIDEASMVSKDLANQVLWQCAESDVFLIASGDRPQLPPVGEDSSFLMDSMEETFTLNQIVRQDHDNPISTVIRHCRDAVETKAERFDPRHEYWESMINEKKQGYRVYYSDPRGIKQVIRAYSVAYATQNFNFVKLAAFTNRACRDHNNFIRQALWGEFANEREFIEGDLVICKSPVTQLDIHPVTGKIKKNVIMTVGTECLVKAVRPIVKEYKEYLIDFDIDPNSITTPVEPQYKIHTYKGWELEIVDTDSLVEDDSSHVKVEVIDQTEQELYLANWTRLRSECFSYNNLFRRNVWFRFFAHEEIFHKFIHSYAVTIHSTQGRTFNLIALDMADITNNAPGDDMRNRLIYVGVSRAKEHLLMV